METIFGIIIAIIPCILTYISMRSSQRTSKIDVIASEQLQKVYMPLHKKLSLFSSDKIDEYKAIEEFVEELFINEYLLIDEVSKSKFNEFSKALEGKNEFTISVKYKSFYKAVDFYFNDLKRQLGYPYKSDWKTIRFRYRYDSRFSSNMTILFVFTLVFVFALTAFFFKVSADNTIILREHTIEDYYAYCFFFAIFDFIFWIVTKLKR